MRSKHTDIFFSNIEDVPCLKYKLNPLNSVFRWFLSIRDDGLNHSVSFDGNYLAIGHSQSIERNHCMQCWIAILHGPYVRCDVVIKYHTKYCCTKLFLLAFSVYILFLLSVGLYLLLHGDTSTRDTRIKEYQRRWPGTGNKHVTNVK